MRSANQSSPVVLCLALLACISLAACGTPEERAAEYFQKARSYFDAGNPSKAKVELRNSLQANPRHAEARYLLALINEQEQDLRSALANLLMAVESDPAFIDARLRLGKYFVVGRRAEEASEQVHALLELAADDPRVQLLAGRLALLQGDTGKALEAGRRALALDPAFSEATSFVALLLARQGDVPAAMAVIDEALEHADQTEAERLRASRVSILAEVGERERGRAELAALARDYPQAETYQLALAELLVADGRLPEAETLLREMIERDPDNAQLRVKLATLLAGAGRAEDAEQSLRAALAADPQSVHLRFALAAFLESAGRQAEAVRVYQQIADKQPRSADGLAARNRLIKLLLPTDRDRAKDLLAVLLADAPDNVDGLLVRAALFIEEGELARAIGDLRSALARQPASTRALLALARVYALNREMALAEETYRRLLAVDPGNLEAMRELGDLLAATGDPEEAEQWLRRARKLGADDRQLGLTLVKTLLARRDFAAAEREARRLLASGGAEDIANYQLGLALEGQGQVDAAIAAYQASLQAEPLAAPPLLAMIRLQLAAGRHAEARDWLSAHLAAHPDDLQASLLMAEVLASNGERGQAEAIYRKMLEKHSETTAVWLGLAALYPPASDERLAVLREAWQANPRSAQLGLALGSTHEKRAEYEEAIAVYERSLAQSGDNDVLANNLAALLLDYRDDRESHERAFALASRFANQAAHPFSLGVLGWAHYRLGDYQRAVRYLERAVAGADVAQLHYYLGAAYLAVGDPVNAAQHLKRATGEVAAGQPGFTGLERARELLASLETSLPGR